MPSINARAVRVDGLRDLSRAFAVADKTLAKELREGLKDAGEPVRADAENLARERVRNIGQRWPRMRVGVTQRLVYVAPREKGVVRRGDFSRRRPNLAGLLMDRAMQPALDQNVNEVENRLGRVLDEVGKAWERA